MGEKGTAGYEAMKRGLLPSEAKGGVDHTITGAKTMVTVVPWQIDVNDPDRAFNPASGQNAVWDDEKQQWTDAKTGQPIGVSGVTPIK